MAATIALVHAQLMEADLSLEPVEAAPRMCRCRTVFNETGCENRRQHAERLVREAEEAKEAKEAQVRDDHQVALRLQAEMAMDVDADEDADEEEEDDDVVIIPAPGRR
jgi:ribosome recycling factor